MNAYSIIFFFLSSFSLYKLFFNIKKSLNRKEKELVELQSDPSTFCTEPNEESQYSQWKTSFLLSTKTEKITLLLNQFPKLKESYKKFVPSVVSYEDFWERYFYRANQLEEKEMRRAALIERANKVLNEREEDELKWVELEEDKEEDLKEIGKEEDKLERKGEGEESNLELREETNFQNVSTKEKNNQNLSAQSQNQEKLEFNSKEENISKVNSLLRNSREFPLETANETQTIPNKESNLQVTQEEGKGGDKKEVEDDWGDWN